MTRIRLARIIKEQILRGHGVVVAASAGITSSRLTLALAEPHRHVADFNLIAAQFGYEPCRSAHGFYRPVHSLNHATAGNTCSPESIRLIADHFGFEPAQQTDFFKPKVTG